MDEDADRGLARLDSEESMLTSEEGSPDEEDFAGPTFVSHEPYFELLDPWAPKDQVQFAEDLFTFRGCLGFFGHRFRCCKFPQFFAKFLVVLRDWRWYLRRVLADIEAIPCRVQREGMRKTALSLLSNLGQVSRDIEMELRYSSALQKPGVDLVCVAGDVPDLCEALKVDALVFQQQFLFVYAAWEQPLPTGGAPWLPTIPDDELEYVQFLLTEQRLSVYTLLMNVVDELVLFLQQGVGETAFIDMFERFQACKGGDASERLAEQLRQDNMKVESLVTEFFQSTFRWDWFVNEISDALTRMTTETTNPLALGTPIETYLSMLTRFCNMLWVSIIHVASRYPRWSTFQFLDCMLGFDPRHS